MCIPQRDVRPETQLLALSIKLTGSTPEEGGQPRLRHKRGHQRTRCEELGGAFHLETDASEEGGPQAQALRLDRYRGRLDGKLLSEVGDFLMAGSARS